MKRGTKAARESAVDAVSVFDLPQNDIAACERYWRAHEITGEDWRIMLRLQTTDAGRRALIKAAKKWPARLAAERKRSRPLRRP